MKSMQSMISKRACMVVFNGVMLVFLWHGNHLHSDLASIVALVVVIVVMNLVAWRSTKDFSGWK